MKTFRKAKLLSVLILVSFTVTVSGETAKRTVIDHLNRSVEVMSTPARIVSIHPIATQIIYILNAQDSLVAFDNLSPTRPWVRKIDPAWASRKIFAFGDGTPNVEGIAALKPDIVICAAYYPAEAEQISKVATVIAFDFHLRGTVEAVDLIGKAIGKEKEAKELIAYIEKKTNAITAVTGPIPRDKRPTTMYETYQGLAGGGFALSTCGNKAYQHGLIEKAGGINLGENYPVIWQVLNNEELMKWDPDVMFMRPPVEGQKSMTLEDLRKDPVLSQLTLVKQGKYYLMPDGEFSSSVNAPEGIIGLMFMAKKLYPDAFAGLSLESEVREFYAKWYRYKLSDQEISSILNPK